MEQFWRITPREFWSLMEGFSHRLDREHDDRMSLAWAIVQLPRQKGPLRLQDLLSRNRRPKTPRAPKDDLALWSAWASATTRRG